MNDIKTTVTKGPMVKYAGIAVLLLFLAFLLGFIPMWLKANRIEKAQAAGQAELRLSAIQSLLASAAIDARRGEYEPARQAASKFFTALREEVDRGTTSAFTAAQREAMPPLFNQRDGIVTLLARSDPASADRLSDLYVGFRKAVGR
jgi:hypothetical protein